MASRLRWNRIKDQSCGAFLFAMVMDGVTNEVWQESLRTIMFADGIVVCSESREQVENTSRGGGMCWEEGE